MGGGIAIIDLDIETFRVHMELTWTQPGPGLDLAWIGPDFDQPGPELDNISYTGNTFFSN